MPRPCPGFSPGITCGTHLEGWILVTGTMRRWGWVLAVGAGLGAAGCGYNTIQTYDEQVNAAASQIKVQLQRPADPLPNLGEAGEGVATQERHRLTEGWGG